VRLRDGWTLQLLASIDFAAPTSMELDPTFLLTRSHFDPMMIASAIGIW